MWVYLLVDLVSYWIAAYLRKRWKKLLLLMEAKLNQLLMKGFVLIYKFCPYEYRLQVLKFCQHTWLLLLNLLSFSGIKPSKTDFKSELSFWMSLASVLFFVKMRMGRSTINSPTNLPLNTDDQSTDKSIISDLKNSVWSPETESFLFKYRSFFFISASLHGYVNIIYMTV